jgi:hypothetical protein
MELSMETISTQEAYEEIRLLWIGLVCHLIYCVETVSPERSFKIALLVSFANNESCAVDAPPRMKRDRMAEGCKQQERSV